MKSKSNKMSTVSCIAMAIGAIIGAGLFTSLPLGITIAGPKVGWAFIAAAIFISLRTLPSLYIQSSLPVSGSSYIYLARLVHPSLAFVQSLNSVIGALNIAVMSITFANYFAQLFPEGNINTTLIAVICMLVFAALGTFGARLTGTVQNVIVLLLFVALGLYIFLGIGRVDAAIAVDFITPTLDFATIWGAVAILNYSLNGGAVVASFADEVENPGKTIPLSFFIGTGVVAVIYIVISFITYGLGPIPGAENAGYNLGAIAATFMSPMLVRFFIVAGALLATITTLNGSFMIYSRIHAATANDGVWPKIFAKTNKYRVPYVSLWACTLFAMVMLFSGLKLNDILRIVSLPGMLLSLIFYLPPLLFEKRYPNAAKRAYLHLPRWLNLVLCIFSSVMSLYMGWSLLTSIRPAQLLSMGAFYLVGYLYYFLRWKYMKGKGIDIIAQAKGTHPQWEERNAPLETAEKAK